MEQAKCILRLFVSPSLENCRNILSFDIYQADDRDEYNRRKGVTKVRVNRGLKRATANSLHDDVTRSAGVGEIFPNLLYPFSNSFKKFSSSIIFYIFSWPISSQISLFNPLPNLPSTSLTRLFRFLCFASNYNFLRFLSISVTFFFFFGFNF